MRARRLHAPVGGQGQGFFQLSRQIDRRWSGRLLAIDQRGVEAHREVAPEDRERSLARDPQRSRPFQLAIERHREQVRRAALQLHLGMEVGDEVQRRDLQQHVETDVAFDTEAIGRRIGLRARAELHGIGGDREVRRAGQPRVVARRQRNRDALELGQISRRRELRMQTADRKHEARARPRAPARAQRHRASQRIGVRELRIDQHRIDRRGARIEVEHPDRIELQADQVVVGRRQERADTAQHQQALPRRRTRGSTPDRASPGSA